MIDFDIQNLAINPICHTRNGSPFIDVILTQKPNYLMKFGLCSPAISDCHDLVYIIMKPNLKPMVTIQIRYCSYRSLNDVEF